MRSTRVIILNVTTVALTGRCFKKKCREKTLKTPPNRNIPDITTESIQLLVVREDVVVGVGTISSCMSMVWWVGFSLKNQKQIFNYQMRWMKLKLLILLTF